MSMTEAYLGGKAHSSVPGKGVKQADMPGGPSDTDDRNEPADTVGNEPAGTSRPAGLGNAGGSPGDGAKGSGTAIAQGKVVGSGHLNVGASGEGKSAVDGTSAELRSTKAPNRTFGNKEQPVNPGALFPGVHD